MYVRHRDRLLKLSVVDVVRSALSEGGWLAPDGLGGLGRVEVVDSALDASDLVPVNTNDANRVFVDFGSHSNMQNAQVGSGLVVLKYPVFVDVLARNASTAGMIAEDLRDRFEGQSSGSEYLPLYASLTPFFSAEVVEVFKEVPEPRKGFWVSLKVGLVVYMSGERS